MNATNDTAHDSLSIRPAKKKDCALILELIRELAEYEKLGHEVVASRDALAESLFGSEPAAKVVIAEWQDQPAGFALYFGNYSTFLARPGIYLEDLFVRPEFRSRGIGKALLSHLAQRVIEGNGGRLDWGVLHWNARAINFYRSLGASALEEWLPMRLEDEALRKLAEGR